MFDNKPALEFNNSVQDRLTKICQPLRDYLGIDYFIYGRFLTNNRSLFITTHEDALKFAVTNSKINGVQFQKAIKKLIPKDIKNKKIKVI